MLIHDEMPLLVIELSTRPEVSVPPGVDSDRAQRFWNSPLGTRLGRPTLVVEGMAHRTRHLRDNTRFRMDREIVQRTGRIPGNGLRNDDSRRSGRSPIPVASASVSMS